MEYVILFHHCHELLEFRSHQFINESPLIPIDLDAQYSSSVTPQQAMPLWYVLNFSFPHLYHENCLKSETQLKLNYIRVRGVSQQQINDQVLMDAPNASIDAAVEISILLPEPSVPYWYVFLH